MFNFLKVALSGFVLLLGILSLWSCGDDDNDSLPPKYVKIYGVYDGFVTAGDETVRNIQVQVTDANGQPKAGVQVNFSVIYGLAALTNIAAETNSSGIASADVTLGTEVTEVYIVAEVDGLIGSPVYFSFSVVPNVPASIEIFSGNEQEGLSGSKLNDDLVVGVLDVYQNPIPNLTVHFSILKGNGQLQRTDATTDAEGLARSSFTTGNSAAENIVRATIGSLQVDFTVYSFLPAELKTPEKISNGIKLTWKPNINPNLFSMTVYRTIGGYGNPQLMTTITDVNQTSFTDTDALIGINYSYQIKSISSHQNAVLSNEVSGEYGEFITFNTGNAGDMIVDESRGFIYLGNSGAKQILILSKNTLARIDSIQLPGRPSNMSLSNDNSKLFVTLQQAGSFSVINLNSRTIIKTVDVTAKLETNQIADIISTTNGQLFVTARFGYSLKINESDNYSATHAITFIGDESSNFIGDDGKNLFFVTLNALYKVDMTDPVAPVILTNNRIGSGPGYMCLSSNGKRIYTGLGSIIDTNDFTYAGVISYVSGTIALSRDGLCLYSPESTGLRVFNTQTLQLDRTLPVGLVTSALYIDADESHAYVLTSAEFPSQIVRLYKIDLTN